MQELTLAPELSQQTAALFAEMEADYKRLAAELYFTCSGCTDNCCDSYFQHHTYLEWAYLWEGVRTLPPDRLDSIMQRAESNIKQSEKMLANGESPNEICPLNEKGLCSLYSHRLMICRLHGVPAHMVRPDGQTISFPGCFKCQEIVNSNSYKQSMDRTGLYQRMVELEITLLGPKQQPMPKVNLTLAQMLLTGPPQWP